MTEQLSDRTTDKRVVHRYVRKGVIDEKDYERHLKGLPDLAEQAAPVEASIEDEDLDDDEDDAEGAA